MRLLSHLIGIHFLLILSLVFDKIRVVFAVLRILFFIDGMRTTPILPIAVSMVHLSAASLHNTSPKFWNAIRCTNVNIKRVELMRDGLPCFGQRKFITFNFIRRTYYVFFRINKRINNKIWLYWIEFQINNKWRNKNNY